jgi:hypothetical protein
LSDNGSSASTIFDGLSDLVGVKQPPPPGARLLASRRLLTIGTEGPHLLVR